MRGGLASAFGALGATWEALEAQQLHYYFQSIPFKKIPQINSSKGLALWSPILGLASHINRFEHPLTLKGKLKRKFPKFLSLVKAF